MLLFEKKFKDSLNSKVPLLDKILHYIVKRKGKQMRPMFVFLSGKIFGEINESSFRAASLIELLWYCDNFIITFTFYFFGQLSYET